MHRPRPRHATLPRDRAFWIATGVLIVGQLFAFWTVCTQQVRAAQERHASAQAERVAVLECLRSVPNASRSTCIQRVAPADSQLAASDQDLQDAVPVNYVYH